MQTNRPHKVAVFGGTFDPIHLGHLVMAEQCREQARLDEVWFVPAARPPHKQRLDVTPFDKRLEMLQLAIVGQPAFRVSEIENERPGPSYLFQTLEDLKNRQPGVELHFLIGSDSLHDLPQWREPARIVELAALLVVQRRDFPVPPESDLLASLQSLRMQRVDMPLIDLSSRDLRCRAAEGRSLRFMVPRAVECYIETHRLYKNTVKA
jgi:nicotinate-nucleotide adenylyltransferase